MPMYRCVYCLRTLNKSEKTVDHVIATSWFPENTPPNIEKWQVPSCRDCNHKFSKIEEDVGLRMAMCLDRKNPAATGIVEKALRAIDPSQGKNEKDQLARKRKRQKLLAERHEMTRLPPSGVLPSFQANWDIGSRTAFLVPADALHSLIKKWARGVHFATLGRLIKRDENIDIFHLPEETAEEAFRDIKPHATLLRKGPGVEVMQASASESGQTRTLYAFKIWDQYQVYALVDERD